MKFSSTFALLSSLALSSAVFEPTIEDVNEKVFGNVRSLFDEDLPLPKDWIAGAKEDAPSKFVAFGGNHQHQNNHDHDVYGSYPYGGGPGGDDGHGQPGYPTKPTPAPYTGDNTRVLSAAQDLPLPTDWMVAATKDSIYGGGDNGGGHHEHGSYPYGGGPGGQDGDEHHEDSGYGYPGYGDNTYPTYGGDHEKMAAVPAAVAYTPKRPVVRSLETVMFKKAQDDQKTPFYLRGRKPST